MCVRRRVLCLLQAHSEKKKVQAQLRLRQRDAGRVGVDPAVLQRVCLCVYPVWKKLRGTLLKKAGRNRQGLCDARQFCRVLERGAARVPADDAALMAHAFYEDRGVVDGVNYARFLEMIVRNFVGQ